MIAPQAENSSDEPTLRHVLRHVARVFHERFRAELMRLGITIPAYEAMYALRRVPNMSSAELSRWMRASPQNANQVLKQLVEKGLVERFPASNHGRILESRLTDEGLRAIAACEAVGARLEDVMTAEVNDSDLEHLRSVMATMSSSLGSPIGVGLSIPLRLVAQDSEYAH